MIVYSTLHLLKSIAFVLFFLCVYDIAVDDAKQVFPSPEMTLLELIIAIVSFTVLIA